MLWDRHCLRSRKRERRKKERNRTRNTQVKVQSGGVCYSHSVLRRVKSRCETSSGNSRPATLDSCESVVAKTFPNVLVIVPMDGSPSAAYLWRIYLSFSLLCLLLSVCCAAANSLLYAPCNLCRYTK